MSAHFVYITVPNLEDARELGRKLVDHRLAGCVNILPKMESLYHWEGQVQHDVEAVLIAKSTEAALNELKEFVMNNHSYTVPCIASIKVDHLNDAYASWLSNHIGTGERE